MTRLPFFFQQLYQEKQDGKGRKEIEDSIRKCQLYYWKIRNTFVYFIPPNPHQQATVVDCLFVASLNTFIFFFFFSYNQYYAKLESMVSAL
uniref:Uncharacterized protein n=1 Tax=Brugia timori TaxID=42155 RepID=A0A0R3QNL8_9BILA